MLLTNSIVKFTIEITCSGCRKKEKPGREVACSENSANLANFGTKVASTQMMKLFLIFCPPSLCSALLFVSHFLLFLTFLLLLTFRSVCPCCRTLCSGRAGRSAKATTHQCQVRYKPWSLVIGVQNFFSFWVLKWCRDHRQEVSASWNHPGFAWQDPTSPGLLPSWQGIWPLCGAIIGQSSIDIQ